MLGRSGVMLETWRSADVLGKSSAMLRCSGNMLGMNGAMLR
jgi:hypothetical protein